MFYHACVVAQNNDDILSQMVVLLQRFVYLGIVLPSSRHSRGFSNF